MSNKEKAEKLKKIALENILPSERIKAIDLIGELGEDAFDSLTDVARTALLSSERARALELIEKIFKERKN